MNLITGIEWTDATSNPFKFRDKETGEIVWACVKHSSGCANCYSETLAKRYGRGGPFTKDSMAKVEPFICDKELKQLLNSKKLTGKRVFVGDMTDIFGEWVTDDMLNKFFHAIENRTDVIFQLLTKRADRMNEYLSWRWGEGRIPSRHIWSGVSVENQAAADERIPLLLQTPAAVRFLSCEPLLGPIEFSNVSRRSDAVQQLGKKALDGIDWVIVGGESGRGARPCRVEWIRSIVEQCKAAGVACFVKQLGAMPTTECNSEPFNGSCGHAKDPFTGVHHLRLRDKKGGDISEFSADLRVRQFPKAVPA